MRTVISALALLGVISSWAVSAEPPAEMIYKKTPQTELKLLAHYPADWKADDRRPAIVFFFGGGWNSGSPGQFEGQAAYLATRGMVALRADYRVKSRHGVTPDQCVEDARSAMRYIRSHASELGIDPAKIIAAGGSAGGHLAACTGTVSGPDAAEDDLSVSPRPAAMVLFNPVLLMTGRLASRLGKKEELAETISPNLHISPKTPPTLMHYGTADQLIEHGKQFLAKAEEQGVRAELYEAPNMGHGYFNRPPWFQRTLYRTDQFLESLGFLSGPPTLKLPAEDKSQK